MGRRDRSVTTYGRHRQRVVATDVWSSDDDKKKHVFSFSAGSINLSSTDSEGSWLESTKNTSKTTANKKNCQKDKKNAKTAKNKGVNKENRYMKKATRGNQKGKRFTVFSESDKDTCSSIGGESLTLSDKPITRRVLRDRNILTDSSTSSVPTPKRPARRQRPSRKAVVSTQENGNNASYNFSEFEDYSLVVSSGTPQNPKVRGNNVVPGIETSTPFRDTRKKKSDIGEEIKDVNLSLIDPVEDSPVVPEISCPRSPNSSSDVSHMQVSHYVPSPSLLVSSRNNKDTSCLSDVAMDCQDNKLRRLEESIKNIHISERSQNTLNHEHSSNCSVSSFQQSQSLFDSPAEIKTSLSRKSDREISPHSCLVELKKMRDSFIRSHIKCEINSPESFNCHNTRSTSAHNTRSTVGKAEVVSHVRKTRLQHNDSDLCSLDGSGEELEESGSCSEDEDEEQDEEDLSDIFEDEEESISESEGEEEDNSGQEEDEDVSLYDLVDKDCDADWSDGLESINKTDGDMMDMSHGQSSIQHKSVYYSAESDGSYHTADGSSSIRNDKLTVNKWKKQNHDRTCGSPNLSRSFVEMLTPKKVHRSKASPLTPRSKLFHNCEQKSPLSFHDIIPDCMMKKMVKIGEGVYGEVFRAQRKGESVAIKIIPIEGDFEVNDEPQKTFAEILPEVVISKELSNLRQDGRNSTPNFCQVISAACVQGSYPDKLLNEWDNYNKKRKSENDRPDMFTEDQLFIVFEFADGGTDLESFQFANPGQARSVLQQVTVSLAVGEEELQFEHRDLHIGNVLVRPTGTDSNIKYRLSDVEMYIESQSVIVSIIDFTLSRLRKDGCTVFCDLAKDDALYEGSGDYQFDIYRNMKEENKNEWEPFNPHSNILWLHYLVDKLLKQKKYKRNGRQDREAMRFLRQFQAEVLTYQSAKHLVLESALFQT